MGEPAVELVSVGWSYVLLVGKEVMKGEVLGFSVGSQGP